MQSMEILGRICIDGNVWLDCNLNLLLGVPAILPSCTQPVDPSSQPPHLGTAFIIMGFERLQILRLHHLLILSVIKQILMVHQSTSCFSRMLSDENNLLGSLDYSGNPREFVD